MENLILKPDELIKPIIDRSDPEMPDLAPYDVIDCLKAGSSISSYLCADPVTEKKFLAKVTRDESESWQFKNEYDMLHLISRFSHPQAEKFPKAVRLEEKDGLYLYIREFIPGRSLETIVDSQSKKPGLPITEAVRYIICVLNQLAFLHSLTPPIIHRDVKPQNVIINDDRDCFLIDLGISRFYRKDGEVDTRIAGTRAIAPPEQFGYRQTDARSDIYMAGILLRYSLTGDYRNRGDQSITNKKIQKIIRKAARFDPDQRYQSADEMIRDLK